MEYIWRDVVLTSGRSFPELWPWVDPAAWIYIFDTSPIFREFDTWTLKLPFLGFPHSLCQLVSWAFSANFDKYVLCLEDKQHLCQNEKATTSAIIIHPFIRVVSLCCRSHLINIYGILLKIKIDAVVKSFNGPLVLLDHHQHNLAALPTKIPHDRESSVNGRFWDGFQCQPKVPMIQRATRCIRVTPVCTNMSHL